MVGIVRADEDELARRKTAYNVGYALISDDTTIRQLREYKTSLAGLFATDNLAAAFELGIKNAMDGKEKLDSPSIIPALIREGWNK